MSYSKLSPFGQQLVEQVNDDRLRDIETILQRLPHQADRRQLATALTEFAEAAGEIVADPRWDLSGGLHDHVS